MYSNHKLLREHNDSTKLSFLAMQTKRLFLVNCAFAGFQFSDTFGDRT